MARKPADRFGEAFRRRPALARRGLLPGRRVAVSLLWAAVVASLLGVSALGAGALLDGGSGDRVPEPVAAPRPVVEVPAVEPTEEEPTEEPTEEEEPAEEEPAEEPAPPPPPPVVEEPVEEEEPAEEEPAGEEEPAEEEPAGEEEPATRSDPAPGLIADGTYHIVNGIGTCLDRSNSRDDPGTVIWSFHCNSSYAQTWQVRAVGDDTYRLETPGGTCAAVQDSSQEMGALIRLNPCSDATAQYWKARDVGDGYVELHAGHSPWCLDVKNGDTTSTAEIRQWHCNNARPERWRFDRA
ncbi:RICIN domain-containing protein [Streptomyces sp. MS19]|uniref:RICIN domain-containing protein n=1 Tax=Streptomyces sp. MS19 TaxID=3385972 RepID=UPI0039A38107